MVICLYNEWLRIKRIWMLFAALLTERLSGVSIPMGARYTFGPVTTSDSGSVLRCASGNVFAVESATLDVTCECHPCM